MSASRPALFRKLQFDAAVIVTCVRWYLRFSLSLRDVEELMAERNLAVDHTTVWCWVQAYAPEIRKRLQGQLKYKRTTWFMDETYVRVIVTRPSASCRPHSRIPTTGRRACSLWTETAAIEQRSANCTEMVSLSES